MALRRQHIAGLSRTIAKMLQETPGVRCTRGESALEAAIQSVFDSNQAAERELDVAADALLDQQLRKMGNAAHSDDLNFEKARQLIKKELAKKRGFIL